MNHKTDGRRGMSPGRPPGWEAQNTLGWPGPRPEADGHPRIPTREIGLVIPGDGRIEG